MKSLSLAGVGLLLSTMGASAWEPTKSVEIIVPFGPGGASDQMARSIQAIIQKHNLSTQSLIVVNKPAATGGEAMLDMKKARGDAHIFLMTSRTMILTPMASGFAVFWDDFS